MENKRIKGILTFGILGFLIVFILTKNMEYSVAAGAICILIFILFESGEIKKFSNYLEKQDRIRINERHSYERREAKGEYARREHGKARREKLRREHNTRQRNFFNNPLGMGR